MGPSWMVPGGPCIFVRRVPSLEIGEDSPISSSPAGCEVADFRGPHEVAAGGRGGLLSRD
jgi:hypothetical protein